MASSAPGLELLLIDGDDQRRVIGLQELLGEAESALHEGQPLRVPIRVISVDVVVAVLPVACTGVVGRVDVDAIDLAGMGELQCFENVMVLALDDDVGGLVAARLERPEATKTWIYRFAEVRDDDQLGDTDHVGLAIGRAKGGVSLGDPDDLSRLVPGVIPQDHPSAASDRVLRELDSLGEVLLEHQTEPALGTEQLDLALQVGPERRVIDLVEQNVEFASHVDSLFAVHAAVRSRSVRVRRRRH